MRFLVTGRVSGDGDDLAPHVRHLAPVTEIDAANEEAARDELSKLYPGQAIYHLRLWQSVTI